MRKYLFAGLVVVALVGASACGQKYSAERDGKDAGQALCDLRDAESADEAQAALEDLNKQLDDLSQNYAIWTAEDRADIQNNLADLAEHVIQGNDVLVSQDIAVIQRSIDNIRDDVSDTQQAALDGIQQGLSDCID